MEQHQGEGVAVHDPGSVRSLLRVPFPERLVPELTQQHALARLQGHRSGAGLNPVGGIRRCRHVGPAAACERKGADLSGKVSRRLRGGSATESAVSERQGEREHNEEGEGKTDDF